MKVYWLILLYGWMALPFALAAPKAPKACAHDFAQILHHAKEEWRTKNETLAAEIAEWAAGKKFAEAHPQAKLSSKQIAVIKEYVEEYHYEINKMLRKGEDIKTECPDCWKFYQNLRAALEKVENYEGVVYRGANIRDKDLVARLLQPGSVFKDPAFMSTSRNPATADRFRMGQENFLFVIHSKRGKDIHPLVDGRLGHEGQPVFEHEVLFLPGSEFKVDKVIRKPNGTNVIFVEELP